MFSSEILTQPSSAWLCRSSPGLAHIVDSWLTAWLKHTELTPDLPPTTHLNKAHAELVYPFHTWGAEKPVVSATLWSHWNRRTPTKGGSTPLRKPGTKQIKERPRVWHDSREAKAEPHPLSASFQSQDRERESGSHRENRPNKVCLRNTDIFISFFCLFCFVSIIFFHNTINLFHSWIQKKKV